jgi:tRNA pseudouridine55 synthase
VKNQLIHSFPSRSSVTAVRPTAGIWLAHKPVGASSFELVQQFQARLASMPGRPMKVCHGGALDPFANGLLPILVGPATKLFEWLHDAPKQYRATISWGTETDTGDLHGAVTKTGPADQLTADQISAALKPFIGWSEQVPPATSNKRVDGERAYEKAHRGETFELPPSRVYLHRAQLTPESRTVIELVCRGGFYVRSLVRDVGRALGVPAHLETLTREAIGPWLDPGIGHELRLEPENTLPWLPSRLLNDDEWGRVKRGVAVAMKEPRSTWAMPPGFPAPKPQVCGLHGGALVGLFDANDNGTMTLRTELHGINSAIASIHR